jgi:hypothetical protein
MSTRRTAPGAAANAAAPAAAASAPNAAAAAASSTGSAAGAAAPGAAAGRRTTPRTQRTPPASAGVSARSDEKKRRAQAAADASWSLPPLPDSLLQRPPERWICVHFKLLHISLLDDVVRLPPHATLHTLEARLIAHHGGAVSGIEMHKNGVQPQSRLRDFSKTLKEVFALDDAMPATVPNPNIPSSSGLGPAMTLSPDDHHVVVCYEFKCHDSDCPLLNRSPRYRSTPDASSGALAGGAGASPAIASAAAPSASAAGSGGRAAGAAAAAAAAASAGGGSSSGGNAAAVEAGASSSQPPPPLGTIGLSAPLAISTQSGEQSVGVGGGASARGASTRS